MKTKPSLPLKWHGGKHYLAERIIALMPKHVHYVEPYFGGGAVLFAKNPEGVSEAVNDINRELTTFWTALQHDHWFQEFCRFIEAVPFSQVEWEDSGIQASSVGIEAARFFIRYRQSRQGLGKDFATLSRNRTRRGMNEQVSSWLSAIEGLPEAHERLKRVVILNTDALDVIQQQDGPNTHFYLDPPYLHETRSTTDAYQYEMDRDQHKRLLKVLSEIKGTFQLSGYRSELYEWYGWRCVEFDLPNNASGAKEKQRKTECVWMNYEEEPT